jgi:hypothetical protein
MSAKLVSVPILSLDFHKRATVHRQSFELATRRALKEFARVVKGNAFELLAHFTVKLALA